MPRNRRAKCRASRTSILVALFFTCASGLLAVGQTSVTTHHYDTYRTGWNQNESVLTPATVGSAGFGLLQNVKLDDQVDAQPLVKPGVQITAGNYQGTHDVVYVATENNTVYAIDVHTGTILLSPNFGTPVSSPLGCNNNGPNVGINSTPVIDASSNTLYVTVYTQASGGPTWTLHALDLGSLTDKVTPQAVSASHTLTNGTTFNFNAKYQRQRAALLLANGSIYAGFGSFCDYSANLSRGWLLGWTAGTLQPFPSNSLNDQQPTAPNSFFLSSVWMSGSGPAADDSGNILFVTGNSDPSGTTYDGVTNIQESVVKVSSTLTSVESLFTPDNQSNLDVNDTDFGSGGVLVLPDQPGSIPHLAVAAGKYGTMYLMNEDSLGGYSSSTNNVLGSYPIGACWCGQSYYVDPTDGLGRVVTSGGNTVGVWRVQTSTTAALTNVANATVIKSGVQDPGFFTSVSSNGTSNPIIWAISRPANNSNGSPISLFAFNPDSGGSTMTQLFQATAGAWPNTTGNANLVPVVANGLVFVASNQQLQIFGLAGPVAAPPTFSPAPGAYSSAQPVTLSDSTPGATIYYTTNGATPSTNSAVFSTSTPIPVSATTTINAIAAASGYSNSAVASGTYSIGNAVNLTSYYNVYGIATVGTAPKSGGFDNLGYAYNSSLLGTSLSYQGMTFTLGPANALDAVEAQTVPLPSGSYTQLYLLGAGANGSQTNQTVVVTYTDGSTSTFTQNFSDWAFPQSYAGETTVLTAASRIGSGGKVTTPAVSVYGYVFNLNAGKTVSSVKLPANRSVVFFAIGLNGVGEPTAATPTFSPAPGPYTSAQPVTLSSATPGATIYYTTNATTPTTSSTVYSTSTPIPVSATTTIEAIAVASGYLNSAVAIGTYTIAAAGGGTAVNLASYYNVYGIATVGTAPKSGGFDNLGYAYNSSLLGASLSYQGIAFTLGPANALDAVSNQTVSLPAGQYGQLLLLGAGANGSQTNKTVVVTYTDGSTSTFTQNFSDWAFSQSYAGETIVLTAASRIGSKGKVVTPAVNVYGYAFNLNASKTVSSVKLPTSRSVVFLAIGLGNANVN
jgi:hypothetical protein